MKALANVNKLFIFKSLKTYSRNRFLEIRKQIIIQIVVIKCSYNKQTDNLPDNKSSPRNSSPVSMYLTFWQFFLLFKIPP